MPDDQDLSVDSSQAGGQPRGDEWNPWHNGIMPVFMGGTDDPDPNADPGPDPNDPPLGGDDNIPPTDDVITPEPPTEPPAPASAPPRKYQPSFQGSRLGEDERKKMVGEVAARVGSWDQDAVAEEIISRAEEIAERTVRAHMNNFMAVQEKVAATPEAQIQRIAENMLLEQARTNPGIYDDPLAVEGALHAAALRYGYQTGDVRGAFEIIRKPGAPPSKPATQRGQEQQPRGDDGKFVPAPSGGGGGGGGGSRRHAANSVEAKIRSRFGHLKESDIAVLLLEDDRGR